MYGQGRYCTSDERFTGTPVFTEGEVDASMGVSYGIAKNYKDQEENLILNIYYPKMSVDTMTKRPLVVLVHGGGFVGGSLNGLNDYCMNFAQRGYVAATVEYRLGWDKAPEPCEGDPISQQEAFYRSLQDVHAAVRYLVNNADTYKIDTGWIFAGGTSAGAFTTTNLAFFQQSEVDSMLPYLRASLGSINGSGNTLTDTFRIKGLFHNWGSVFNLGIITISDAIPLIGFAGDRDAISPIDSGYWQGCTDFHIMYGTRAIHERLKDVGICSELNVKVDGGHGVWKDTPEQNIFRIERACCFFKSIFCKACSSVGNYDSIPAACGALNNNNSVGQNETSEIGIYPNPFTDRLNITIEESNLSFRLINSIGREVWIGDRLGGRDFSGLIPGIYYLEIVRNGNIEVNKLIKI